MAHANSSGLLHMPLEERRLSRLRAVVRHEWHTCRATPRQHGSANSMTVFSKLVGSSSKVIVAEELGAADLIIGMRLLDLPRSAALPGRVHIRRFQSATRYSGLTTIVTDAPPCGNVSRFQTVPMSGVGRMAPAHLALSEDLCPGGSRVSSRAWAHCGVMRRSCERAQKAAVLKNSASTICGTYAPYCSSRRHTG